jgi:hypothetical protein
MLDRDCMVLQRASEVVAGELAALIGIEDLGLAVMRERFFEGVPVGNPIRLASGANRVMLMPNGRCSRAAVVCANQLVSLKRKA